MRTHGRQPVQCGEVFACPAIFCCIDDLAFMFQITHAFLRERRPYDVTRQIFHRGFIFRCNPIAAEDVEAGVSPCREHGNQLFRYLSPVQEHPEDLVPKDGLQLFQLKRWRDPEHALVAVEAAVRHQNVTVGIEAEKIAEGLYGNNRAGYGILFIDSFLKEYLQGFPGTTAQIGEKLPVIKEISAEDLRDAEDEMPMGNLFENIHAEPSPEFHHALLVA